MAVPIELFYLKEKQQEMKKGIVLPEKSMGTILEQTIPPFHPIILSNLSLSKFSVSTMRQKQKVSRVPTYVPPSVTLFQFFPLLAKKTLSYSFPILRLYQ